MATETHFRTCPLCEATCGLEITKVDGDITRIRGDRDDVFSKGFICPKGSTLKQLHADPDRLRTPLIKRDGEFFEATWEEAFTAVAERLSRIWADGNRDAVALYLGNPTAHTMAGSLYVVPLIKSLNTKNLYSASTVDQMPKHVSSGYLFGNGMTVPIVDIDRTDYLLMLGANPHESNGSLCTAPDFPGRMAAIRERGGRVVTVDPRRTKTAAASDEHVAIRPGTDALWLAALVTEVATAGLIDLTALDAPVDGLDDVLAALAPFTAESVAAHTRVDPATTRRIAHEFAGAPSAACYGRIGTHTNPFGTLASWLVEVLNIVTGNLDRPGGVMFPTPAYSAPYAGKPPGGRGFSTGRWRSRVHNLAEVRGELPLATLADEILTPGHGQVRALITSGGNPARSGPNSEHIEAALESLEFMVSVDIYLNETTRHADVILPSPSPLAKPHFDFAFYALSVRNIANYSPPIHPATDPSEPGMDEHDIYAKLALIAAGMGPEADPSIITNLMLTDRATKAKLDVEAEIESRSNMNGAAAMLDIMLSNGPYEGLNVQSLLDAPHGVDLGPLMPRINEVLTTVSGHVELAAPPLIADVGRLVDLLNDPPHDGLLLVGRRHLRSNNSWMHNVEVLVKGKPRCTLLVHPADAATLGLVDGGSAEIASEAGALVATVEVTDDVSEGTVSLPHGWGHDSPGTRQQVASANAGVNSNILSPDATDPLSGNAFLTAIPVTVTAR